MLTFNQRLKKVCTDKNNRLCIGLDLDNEKLSNPSLSYMEGYIKDIIDCTIDHCPIYKINFSFYEKHGSAGYKILEKIPDFIDNNAITIADAKRGDIGNSSKYYANSIFALLNYDSITVSPYMGNDSIQPFIDYSDKGVFILCLTSNSGSKEYQQLKINDKELYKHVAQNASNLNMNDNIGIVVGATNNAFLNEVKEFSGDIPWLMPGVGAQGGDLESAIKIEGEKGLSIINVSRGVLYAGNGTVEDIRKASLEYTKNIREVL